MSSSTPALTTKSLLRIVARDVGVLLGLFLALELVLRLVAPQPVQRLLQGVYATDPTYGLTFAAGTSTVANNGFGDHVFAINSFQARDSEHGPKQPGELRILVVGDSFSENQAVDVDKLYANVLEAELGKRLPGQRVTVINAGMAGWGLWQYYTYLDQWLAKIEPDLVVLSIGITGDFVFDAVQPAAAGMALYHGQPVWPGGGWQRKAKFWAWYGVKLLDQYSHAFVALRVASYWPSLWLRVGSTPRLTALVLDNALADKVREPTTQALKVLVKKAGSGGAKVAVLSVPMRYEALPEAQQERIQWENPDLTRLDFNRPTRLLAELTAAAQVPLCDPRKGLAAATEPTYFPRFDHWNEAGNRVVAQTLLGCLERDGLLPAGQAPVGQIPAGR